MVDLLGERPLAKARFYEELAQCLDSGLPLGTALRTLAAESGLYARAAGRLEEQIAAGMALSEAAARDGDAFEPFEWHALEAGERGGQLPAVVRALAHHFRLRGEAARRIALGLVYPLLLLHAAILLPSLFVLVRDGAGAYLAAVLPALLVLWGLAAAALLVRRALARTEAGRRTLGRAALALPAVGRLARTAALADYAGALGLLYGSGVPVIEAMERAAQAMGNEVFADAGRRAAREVARGAKIAEALAAEGEVFPPRFVDAVRIGEATGKLQETLERAAAEARAARDLAVKAAAVAIPVAIYIGAALYVGVVVVRFYAGYAKILQGL